MAYRHTKRAFRGMGQLATPCGQPGQPSCAGTQPNDYQKSIGITGFNPDGTPIWAPGAQSAYQTALAGGGGAAWGPYGGPAPVVGHATGGSAAPLPVYAAPVLTAAAPATSVPAASPSLAPAAAIQPTGFVEPVPTPAPSTGGFSLSMPILGFPLWLWGAAAVGAFVLFGSSSHGRY